VVEIEQIIVFTRPPVPGRVKTRLIPALGAEGAAALHRRLAEGVLAWAGRLCLSRPVRLEVRHDGGTPDDMRAWLGLAPLYRPQGPGDLGQRMARALNQALAEGARRAVLVGTDLPQLTDEHLAQALEALKRHELVLGPAADGGYYLVGLTRPAPDLFQGVAWGGPEVLAQTLAAARAAGLQTALLPELGDLDRPEDLALLESAPPPPVPSLDPERISVIIPALNEEPNLSLAVESVLRGQGRDKAAEIIVVDGGSQDHTHALASELGVEAAMSFPGRARQMNLGAALASGGILLFLHADTMLPPAWDEQVRDVLARPGVAAGAFPFGLDADGPAFRRLERLVNWRSRALQLPYGDQALFLRAAVLAGLGGYAELPIMEDYELVRRLKRRGRIALAAASVRTSARRWRAKGLARTTLLNQATLLGWHLGLDPARLAAWYRGRGAAGR
jgi:rSAM/selenodomain-associated transferase 2/rSAM/selenodomain-associated transferase 1